MKLKTVAKMTIIPIIALTMSQASSTNDFLPNEFDASLNVNEMTTEQLQYEVEKHSLTGDVPFELGLELIKRWTEN